MNKHTLKKGQLSCDPLLAAQLVGHDYGVPELAEKLLVKPGTMYNKLNPEFEHNHLYLHEAIYITKLADDHRILEAWAHSCGYALVRVPQSVACDEDLSDQLMKLTEVMGEAYASVREARQDGVIDNTEFEQIKSQFLKVFTEAKGLETVLEDQVRELKVV